MRVKYFLLIIILPLTLFAVPNAPTSLVLKALSSGKVSVQWQDNSDDEKSFKIFRNGKLIEITKSNTTSYIDDELEYNTTYTYEVKASDDEMYFVDINGINENSCLKDTPCKTLPYALSLAHGGATVYIRGGEYPLGVYIDKSGDVNNSIVISSYPTEFAVFNGTKAENDDFKIVSNWLVVKNLEITNSRKGVVLTQGASYNLIENIDSHHNLFSGFDFDTNASYNIFKNCDSHHNHDESGNYPIEELSYGVGNQVVYSRAWKNSDYTSAFIFHLKENDFEKEIIVSTIRNIQNKDDVDSLVNKCATNHISWISIACKQDEDSEISSGKVFYPSSIAPVADGYASIDLIDYLIQVSHDSGIKVKAWIPQFHDKIAFDKNTSWQMMEYKDGNLTAVGGDEYFVNPINKDVQDYELSIIQEIVENYTFDAVVLDWVRFDGYNMDLSDSTRVMYENKFGYDPISIDFSVDSANRKEWNTFREDVIASYIKRVKKLIYSIKPNLSLGAYVLSPYWDELGQNPTKFREYLDFISPMAYYDDWGYPLEWIYGDREDAILPLVRKEVYRKEIIPVFEADWKDSVYTDIFENSESFNTMSFFIYNKWTQTLLENIGSL